jgi:uncharacterized damage-inducible protein DinB
MTADEARNLIRYTTWATTKVLESVKALPEDLREKPNGISHESIAGTVAHTYWADLAWLVRVRDSGSDLPGKQTYADAAVDWPKILQGWNEWAAALADADTARIIEYRSVLFGKNSSRIDEIVMHVTNHATLHRGQIVGMIRQLGIDPPKTDMIYFFREQAAARAAS